MAFSKTDKIPVMPDTGTTIHDCDGYIHILSIAAFMAQELKAPLGSYTEVKTLYAGEGAAIPANIIVYGDTDKKRYQLIGTNTASIPETDGGTNWLLLDTASVTSGGGGTGDVTTAQLVAALANYTLTTDVNTQLATKADTTFVNTELDKKIDKTSIDTVVASTDVGVDTEVPSTKAMVDYVKSMLQGYPTLVDRRLFQASEAPLPIPPLGALPTFSTLAHTGVF